MVKVYSYQDFVTKLKGKEKAYLLLYKPGSEKNDCAYNNIILGSKTINNIQVFFADVNNIKDIHTHYNITTVPALLEFENGNFQNVYKGCNGPDFYRSLFENAIYYTKVKKEDQPAKRVIVYSAPSCSWCNTLKTYLKIHRVQFSDIDISKDQRAVDELVRRSGQMGIPQIDINGEIIVGFNKARINELLNIRE